jgi:Ser/Thr protein kinase RdoA (MazF antagonist)
MQTVLSSPTQQADPLEISATALGVRPLRAVRQGLSESGKSIYRIDLPSGESAVLRTSDRANAFAFTRQNLQVLRALGLPVQTVLATARRPEGGSYILLNWLSGRDLVHELAGMSGAQMTHLAEQVVECQKRVGGLPQAARFGWAPIGRSGNLEKWTQIFGEPASAAAVDDGTRLGGLRARLCTLRSRVEPYFDTVKPVAFLDDLTTKNVLVDNGVLSGIIDVDFICYGDPLHATGATMACIVADALQQASFYGDELMRCWNPDGAQRRAIWFYAALWAIGLFQKTDASTDPIRSDSLYRAAQAWLSRGEAE